MHDVQYTHTKLFNDLSRNIDKSVISDVNDYSARFYSPDMINKFGLSKKKCDINITRLIGNIEPHYDKLLEYQNKAYVLVLGIGSSNRYTDSQELPLFYQAGNFLHLRKGDMISFDQSKDHALFWDRRIDIATFFIIK